MKFRTLIKIISPTLIVTALVGGGAYAYATYTTADDAVSQIASSGTLSDIVSAEALNGESTGQVNILIAGNSADDAGHSGAELTDSIMVASIDITTKKVSLISIPRDLWVSYGGTSSKINAVYVNGGMDGLQSVVGDVTGLTINHSMLLNYTALRTMIDSVGGIDVTIDSSDPRGIYDPMIGFRVANGPQHLSGEQALLLARSRNDPTYDGRVAYGLPNGDFDRQEYQRKIVQALVTKIVHSSAIINPSTLTKLVQAMNGNVTTDFSVGQIRRLYDLGSDAATESISIRSDANGSVLLADYTSYDGQSALVPADGTFTAIHAYLQAVLPAVELSVEDTA